MHEILTMKELPVTEQPYEKAYSYGVSTLSDAELLAVIIRSGTKNRTSLAIAYDVLNASENYPGLLGLYHMGRNELCEIAGIGDIKATELMCIAELSKRMARLSRMPTVIFNTPDDVAAYFMEEMRSLEAEHFYALYLDAKSALIKYEVLFKGSVNQSAVYERELLKNALKADAAQIIVLHNHPGGDPSPSNADLVVTEKIIDACEAIGIPLVDHIIIGDNIYVSLAARSELFKKT